jgi:hypothetical protein
MPKLCRCGKIVDDRCEACSPRLNKSREAKQPYMHDHRVASEMYRAERPLCEMCLMVQGVELSSTSVDMHHIQSVSKRPDLRMKPSNWLSLCRKHHSEIEGNEMLGMEVKRWSDENYERLMGCSIW